MIVCPNCNHPNPDGAVQCEACYTPLPATVSCSSCGATVQADASFCGQCGFNLRAAVGTAQPTAAPPTVAIEPSIEAPPLVPPETALPQPIVVTVAPAPLLVPDPEPLPPTVAVQEVPQYTPAPTPEPTVAAQPIATSPPIEPSTLR